MIYSENILVCVAIPLLIALIFTRRSTRRFIMAFVTGMVICLISAYISGFLKIVIDIEQEDMAIRYSPIVEEIMKLLPLVFYMFVFSPKDDKMLIVALGVGLGFATFENCCYILSVGAEEFTYVLIRGLAVGVMHLVCSLALVMSLCISRYYKVFSLPAVVGALATSTTFHGLYNLLVSQEGVSAYLGYFLPLLTAVLLYVPFKKTMNEKF